MGWILLEERVRELPDLSISSAMWEQCLLSARKQCLLSVLLDEIRGSLLSRDRVFSRHNLLMA